MEEYEPDKQISVEEDDNNFKVLVRVRPLLSREILNGCSFSIVDVKKNNKTIHIYEHMNFEPSGHEDIREQLQNPKYYQIHAFNYDYIFNEKSAQREVYKVAANGIIEATLKGYNSTVIAYGQTGTGKTFTMEGSLKGEDTQGIIPQSFTEIFKEIEQLGDKSVIKSIKVSYLQIYNEMITDLLTKNKDTLSIREDKKRGIFVDGLTEYEVHSPEEIMKMMRRGSQSRPTASTKMNEVSSRSHAIFVVTIERKEKTDELTTHSIGKLNFVDLAGSERIRITGATGLRLEECKKINQSLAALGNVISALSSRQQRSHVPYRNSKLTRLLEDSLGGNCKTTMIAMISPAIESFSESLSTLKFASRAKNIKNTPCINGEIEYDPKVLLLKYEEELKNLKGRVGENNQSQIKRPLPQISRIDVDTPSLSREDASQVEKYKGLLLKQRDIMIALTARLNNRDETIIHLQGEMESLTKGNRDLQKKNTQQSEQINNLNNLLRSSGTQARDHEGYIKSINNENRECKISPDIINSSKQIKSGLDAVISALTRDDGEIDLHDIAQRLLTLQKQSHKLDKSVNQVDVGKEMVPKYGQGPSHRREVSGSSINPFRSIENEI